MSWQEFVTIAGAVALVELPIRGAREWQAARRIVPIGALDARMVEEHRLVPTQFAGSRSRVVRALLVVYGTFFVSPRTRKEVFLCTAVHGVRDGQRGDCRELESGDRLRVALANGERAASFVKALKRGGSGGYRTIAVRDFDANCADTEAECVTVRTSGKFALGGDGGSNPEWLQFDVVASAPRSRFKNGRVVLAEVPEDAMHLVVAGEVLDQSSATATETSPPGVFKRWFVRWNANPWVGLGHKLGRYVALYVALLLASAVGGLWELEPRAAAVVGSVLALAAVLLLPVAALRLWLWVSRDSAVATQRAIQREGTTEPGDSGLLPTHLVRGSTPSLWLGATSHCQSVGRKCNGADAVSIAGRLWERIAYKFRHARRSLSLIADLWRKLRRR